jgi:hypothetical protein
METSLKNCMKDYEKAGKGRKTIKAQDCGRKF